MARSASNRVLTDHEEIREWAEERDATPACVRGTGGGGDTGMIRLDFPGYSGAGSLEKIDWDDWFEKFDEMKLALLVQDQTSRGEQSNFNKLIGRETANASARGNNRTSRRNVRGSIAGRRTTTAKKRTSSASKGTSRRGTSSARSTSNAKKKSTGGKAKKKTAPKKASNRRSGAASKTLRGSTRKQGTQTARGRAGSRRRAA